MKFPYLVINKVTAIKNARLVTFAAIKYREG